MDLKDTIKNMVSLAIEEDVGNGDLTAALISPTLHGKAQVIVREPSILCGVQWFNEVYNQLDSQTVIKWNNNDGDTLTAGQILCEIDGKLRSLLTGERSALNFLQTLSATATAAHRFAQMVSDLPVKILDTRKTLPGFRQAQKYAVTCGGCVNHRIGLFDAILIKENHIIAAGSITKAITQARSLYPDIAIEVEVESLAELNEALTAKAERILLDNMDTQQLRDAVALNAGRVELEASGGVDLDTVRDIALTGIDFISVGAMTKDLQAIDLSMRFLNSY